MECEYKKVLLTNPDGTKVYVCTCEQSKCFGKEPKCEDCEMKALGEEV